jgi:hypothetical protein
MTDQHPITPPPKLVGEWSTEAGKLNLRTPSNLVHVANRAAQWGADQELEACRIEIIDGAGLFYIDETSDRVCLADDLRAARRPKPLSLKQQALQELDKVDMLWATEEFGQETLKSVDTIRKALEALPDD